MLDYLAPRLLPLTRHGNKRKSLYHTLDTVPDSVLVLDENGKIRQTNTAAEELFQMNTQDLLGIT